MGGVNVSAGTWAGYGSLGLNVGNTTKGGSSSYGYVDGASATKINKQQVALANAINEGRMAEIMQYNSLEARKQRLWEEQMSNTAYRRAVMDMQAAGINPILAASNGGASTPTGASASASAIPAMAANAVPDERNYSSSYNISVDNMGSAITQLADLIQGMWDNGEGKVTSAGKAVVEAGKEAVKETKEAARKASEKFVKVHADMGDAWRQNQWSYNFPR